MAKEIGTAAEIGRHGALRLPSVEVDSFNIELKDEEGFLGDRASKGAFVEILEKRRKALQKAGKSFEVQVGPDLGHTAVNRDRMMEFFIENLVLK